MRFATIGTSWITESFIKATKNTGLAELTAVYSRDVEKAQQFAAKHGAKLAYDQLDEMLEEDVDFVYIASPNSLHVTHALTCLEHGKHVFCEKPLALTVEQIDKLQQKAEEKQLYIFEGYRHLYSPNYQRLKEQLAKIGPLRSVFLQYIQYSSKYDAFLDGHQPNVFSPTFAGGALMDLGVYPLSMAIDLFGEPNEVDYRAVKLSSGVDGSGTLILTYDAFQVTVMCSKIAQATIPSEFHGEAGTLTIDHIAPIESILHWDRLTGESKEWAGEQLELDMVYELQAFHSMVTQRDDASNTAWLERSRIVAACTEKARKQAGIELQQG
ncbi:Gfo/Idh/MocA family oxidoreductase [Ornithinibacillus gellani]|uniref:Gfo/Idh/MocA family protein n=1 Tax=Ornithinibacillus gellani TaxID=2293253 RepID=UPI000F45FDEF|nr:Gfo/Idh/MocA family oxidoreductase [Ornithinibacillus gellani]TQS76482.1 Gfo/Idh/MocA family oxidoreductase [Ornithinibacillus gellani]